jgi:16S rRNA (uracil1498-N3)-methyltransferase
VKQVLLPPESVQGDHLVLKGQSFVHLVRVRRVGPGEEIQILIPGKMKALTRVEKIEADQAWLRILDRRDLSQDYTVYRVVLSWLKGKKLEEVIRKLTELGTDEIFIFPSEYSVGHPAGREDNKILRWRNISREAAEQSGTERLPVIQIMPDISRVLDLLKGCDKKIFFHQTPLAKPSLHGYLSGYYGSVAIAIGPEGGFSPTELDLFTQGCWQPQTLPTPVLRAETAAVAALSAVKVLTEEKAFWKTHDSPS